MNHPVISVIMGSYNPVNKDELHDAVKSIINQTYKDWEFIICDDGSEEPYASYLSELAKLDERIICIKNDKNHGLAYSLNRCMEIAKGDYIARMDDDDISLPERFEKELDFLKHNRQYAWVGSEAALFDNDGRWGIGSRPEKPDVRDYLKYSPFIHPSVMFRREPLYAVGGYAEDKLTLRCEDYELFMKMAAQGYKGYNLQEILFKYQESSKKYGRKKFRYYFYEMLVRFQGFKRMKIFPLRRLPYALKPLVIAGLSVSPKNLQRLRKVRKADNHAVVYNAKGRDGRRKLLYMDNLHKEELFYKAAYKEEVNGQINTLEENVDKLVLAPVLNGYIIWVLKNAMAQGIERLYFLARDGYLMYKHACMYCRKYNLPIECKYLYCSRYSLRVPLYHKDMEEALAHVCRGGIEVTLRKILIRSGFNSEDISRYEESYDGDLDKVIPYSLLGDTMNKLKSDKAFLEVLKMRSEEAWPSIIGYFEQEGLFENINMAVVDSGWTGTTQKTFNDILRAYGKDTQLKGFYFGLYEIPQNCSENDYFSFYFSPASALKRKVFFSNCLFEAVFSAPHGMTIGYEKKNDVFVPILATENKHTRKLIERIEENITEFTESYLCHITEDKFNKISTDKNIDVIAAQLKLFMWKPTAMEAESYGRIQFSDDLLDSQMQDIATKLSNKDLTENHVFFKLLAMTGIRKVPVRESAWYEASAVRKGKLAGWHRINYALYKALVYIKKMI